MINYSELEYSEILEILKKDKTKVNDVQRSFLKNNKYHLWQKFINPYCTKELDGLTYLLILQQAKLPKDL